MAAFPPLSRSPLSQSPTIEVLIGMGANVPGPAGAPAETLKAAVEGVRSAVAAQSVSAPFPNPAFPQGAGPDFLNIVLIGRTSLPAKALLEEILAIERRLGRVRDRVWQSRPIDIDLLAYGDLVTAGYWEAAARGNVPPDRPLFILPHPRMHFRESVLRPLAEIAPAWRHPALGMTARDLLQKLTAAKA